MGVALLSYYISCGERNRRSPLRLIRKDLNVFKPLGVSAITMLVLDVGWLHIPREPKFYFEFIRQLADVAIEHAGECVLSASGDINEERVALFFSDLDQAIQFNSNWRTVARKVHSEILASLWKNDGTDIPF